MSINHLKLTTALTLIVCLLSVLPVTAKKKIAVTGSTLCSDLTAVNTPDSAALSMFSIFADGKALVKVYNNPDGIKIQLVAADELTQQKWFFNGLTVYIDPTGKEKDKYAIIFPSAISSQQQGQQPGTDMQRREQGDAPQPGMMPDPQQDQAQSQDTARRAGPPNFKGVPRQPDPTRIVQQMNMKGAMFDVDGDSRFAGISLAKLTVTDKKQICYNITLPYAIFEIKNLSPEFMGIGILSEYVQQQMPEGPGGGGGMGGPGGGMGGPGGGMGGPGGGMGGPGGGMGGPGGGMMSDQSSSRKSSSDTRSSEMKKPVKGWIQAKLETTKF